MINFLCTLITPVCLEECIPHLRESFSPASNLSFHSQGVLQRMYDKVLIISVFISKFSNYYQEAIKSIVYHNQT